MICACFILGATGCVGESDAADYLVYWKSGGEWRTGGGLGTITIRDNLRIAGVVVGDFDEPLANEGNYCFSALTADGTSEEQCILMQDCKFFIRSTSGGVIRIYTPKECMVTSGELTD